MIWNKKDISWKNSFEHQFGMPNMENKILMQGTVNFLNIWTPKTFVEITLKFKLRGSTIE